MLADQLLLQFLLAEHTGEEGAGEVTLFCFNFIGDGLRDALDPKDR